MSAAAAKSQIARHRELTAPGRTLNVFESLELEALEATHGQLPLPLNLALMPKAKPATAPAPVQQLLAPQPGEIIQSGSHLLLVPSKTNREHFDKTEMTALRHSIAAHGIIQPLIVRFHPGVTIPLDATAVPGMYEIVAGQRRWTCATELDLQNVPFIVRTYDDRTALEIQKLENLQRENLDPIEEGRGFRQMMAEFGYTLDDLRTRLSKEKSWIYGRIKLAALIPAAVEQWRAGTFGESVALRIARMPAKQQEQFIEKENASPDQPMTDRQAAEIIATRYVKELKGAPFDPEDPELVPERTHDDPPKSGHQVRCFGGKCSDCTLRAGNLPDFDPKAGRADMCLHPACYHAKVEAAFAATAAQRLAAGGQVITAEQIEQVFEEPSWDGDDGVIDNGPLLPGDKTFYSIRPLPGAKKAGSPTLAAAAKHFKLPAVLALHPYTHQIVELYDHKAVVAAATKAGLYANGSGGGDEKWKAEQRKRAAEARRQAAIARHIASEIIATASLAFEKESELINLLRFLAGAFANDASADQARAIIARRQIDIKPFKGSTNGIPARGALHAQPDALGTRGELFALLFELAITPRFCGYASGQPLKNGAKFLGLDYAALEKAAKASLAEDPAKPKTKATAPVKPSKAAAAAKPAKAAEPAKKPGKGQLSPEARARIIAAVKRRWSKAKAKAKKGNSKIGKAAK